MGSAERGQRRQRRWFIGDKDGDGQVLEPYRVKVLLVENRRVEGKVKQEIVAMLGTIDATWLESFWEPLPDASWRHNRWEYFSLTARVAFWDGVLERMGATATIV